MPVNVNKPVSKPRGSSSYNMRPRTRAVSSSPRSRGRGRGTRELKRHKSKDSDGNLDRCKDLEFDNDLPPLVGLTSPIFNLEHAACDDEVALGRLDDYTYQPRVPRPRPLLSSTRNLIDELEGEGEDNLATISMPVKEGNICTNASGNNHPLPILVAGAHTDLPATDLDGRPSVDEPTIPLIVAADIHPTPLPNSPFLDTFNSTGSLGLDISAESRPLTTPPRPDLLHTAMAPSNDEVAAASLAIRRARMYLEDELVERERLEILPYGEIEERINTAKVLKRGLGEAYLTIEVASVDVQERLGGLESIKQCKTNFIEFCNLAWEVLNGMRQTDRLDRPLSSTGSATSARSEAIMTDRVQQRADTSISEAERVSNLFESIATDRPTNHREMVDLESKLEARQTEKKDIVTDLRDLIKTATTAGLRQRASQLNEACDRLTDSSRDALSNVSEARHSLGLPATGVIRSGNQNLKAPKFSGDFTTGLDYFSFIKAFNEYSATLLFSDPDKLLKLRGECLSDAALDSVVTAETFTEAVIILEKLYGKPTVLFCGKEREIIKFGRCPTNLVKRREWLVKLHARLIALRRLSDEHDIREDYDNSNIFTSVLKLLTETDKEDYDNKCVVMMDMDPTLDMSRRGRAERLVNFIDRCAHRAGLQLDHQIAGFQDSDEIFKSLKINDPKTKNQDKSKDSKTEPNSNNKKKSESQGGGAFAMGQGQNVKNGGKRGDKPKSDKIISTDPIPPQKKTDPVKTKCTLCGEHHTHLLYCYKFQGSRATDRWKKICLTQSCYWCTRMDAQFVDPDRKKDWYDSHKINCSDDFLCNEEKCGTYPPYRQNHFTLCALHLKIGKERQKDLIDSMDSNLTTPETRFFSMLPHSYHTNITEHLIPIYMVHFVTTELGEELLIFYDSGCSIGAISTRAVNLVNAKPVGNGPVQLNVAGGQSFWNKYGDSDFNLTLSDGKKGLFTMLQMDFISKAFPLWDLARAYKTILEHARTVSFDLSTLPKCPPRIGGQAVDVMFGIKYLAFHPIPILSLPSGLTIFRSKLQCSNGMDGVIGGPQPAVSQAVNTMRTMDPHEYLVAEIRAMVAQHKVLFSPDIISAPPPPLPTMAAADIAAFDILSCYLCDKEGPTYETFNNSMIYKLGTRLIKDYQMQDELGSAIGYRCVTCRSCGKCRRGEELEEQSLVEESEQALIESCVTYNVEEKLVYSKLPFIVDPNKNLTNNYKTALAILRSQLRTIEKRPGMKEEVIAAHDKLQSRGFVKPISELPPEVQLEVSKGGYFIPWRTVFKESSLSTPVRPVFDASSRTPGGLSLNDCLAKGSNTLAKLLHLLIKFRVGSHAFSADISMAYNAIRLEPRDLKYQKYLWVKDLSDISLVETMIIMTLIYGVKPAGNLTIAGFQAIVKFGLLGGGALAIGAHALANNSYMDDIFSSYLTAVDRDDAANGLIELLEKGSMKVKAITKTHEAPCEKVSTDGSTVGLVGYTWRPLDDTIAVDIKPIALGKAKRGIRPDPVEGDLRDSLSKKFTKRIIAGQVAGLYDPLGICVPVSSRLKVDLSYICKLKTDWDETLPAELLDTWTDNLTAVQQLSQLRIPRDACPGLSSFGGKIQLLACSDASQEVAVAAVYARTRLPDGKISCHLISAKSKLTSKQTIPRAEMSAAAMSAALAHIIKYNFGDKVSDIKYITDSSIVLFWLHQDNRPLQTAVRNQVIEVRRLSNVNDWRYCPGPENPADIGTRKVEVSEILGQSDWLIGRPWMSLPENQQPLKNLDDLKLTAEEHKVAAEELRNSDMRGMVLYSSIAKITKCYEVADYLINPADKPWQKMRTTLAFVHKCISKWKPYVRATAVKGEIKDMSFTISEENLSAADRHIFRQTTAELKGTVDSKLYKSISYEENGIVIYKSRILDCDTPNTLPAVSADLSPNTFCKPVVSRWSPVAVSIMLHAHIFMTYHGSASATLRKSYEIAYIIQGRALAIEIRESCHHCRRYKARVLKAEMGKLHPNRLFPAPVFYIAQTDLVGPFSAHCEHNHRSVVKVWAAVFKCTSSMAVWAEVMSGYSSEHFIQAYTRFSVRFGHPGQLLLDQGSQLIAACKTMELSFADLTKGINGRYGVGVEYSVCEVGSHESNGMVERAIGEIRKLYYTIFDGLKLDILNFQTGFYVICNELNNLPIGLGSKYKDLDQLDLLTANRLVHGRNNVRAPWGPFQVSHKPQRLLKQMESVYDAWWAAWDSEWSANLIPRPSKWPEGKPLINVGNIVVFKRLGKDSELGRTPWRIGRVKTLKDSRDGIVRAATVEYKNANEKVFRKTTRSVRTLTVIHSEDELDFPQQLLAASRAADLHLALRTPVCNGGVWEYLSAGEEIGEGVRVAGKADCVLCQFTKNIQDES